MLQSISHVLEEMPMSHTYTGMGTLVDRYTVRLDKAMPLTLMKVRVIVEPVGLAVRRPYTEVVADIRRRQRARGHHPPTREVVDAAVRAERESWDA